MTTTNAFLKNYTYTCTNAALDTPVPTDCSGTISLQYADFTLNQTYYLTISATDNTSAGYTYNNPTHYPASGGFYANPACLNPFLNTSNKGDVHSNTNINTPGGP